MFTTGKHALGECDRCGFQYKLHQLKSLTIRGKDTSTLVCHSCWEADHPQNELGRFPVVDPQAIQNPRPDQSRTIPSGSRTVQWGWAPVGGARSYEAALTPNDLVLEIQLGSVTVTVS